MGIGDFMIYHHFLTKAKALGTILWTKTFWVNNNFFAAYFHCKNIYRKGIMPHGYIKCDFGADFSQK